MEDRKELDVASADPSLWFKQMLKKIVLEELDDYIKETEHQDGGEVAWGQFKNPWEAVGDFGLALHGFYDPDQGVQTTAGAKEEAPPNPTPEKIAEAPSEQPPNTSQIKEGNPKFTVVYVLEGGVGVPYQETFEAASASHAAASIHRRVGKPVKILKVEPA